MKLPLAAFLPLLATAALLLPAATLRGQNPVPSSPPSLLPRNPALQSAAAKDPASSGAPADAIPIVAPAAGGAASPPPAAASVSGDYVLSPSDTLEMSVFNEPSLTTQTRISADGTVQFPLIGELRLGGMPVRDARELIRRRYNADYLVEPQVYLNVLGYAQRRFTVLGQVNRPGTYDFPGGERLGLLEAIGLAGGFTRLANQKDVEVKHATPNSPTLRVNVKKLTTSDGKAFALSPGDVINVKESWL